MNKRKLTLPDTGGVRPFKRCKHCGTRFRVRRYALCVVGHFPAKNSVTIALCRDCLLSERKRLHLAYLKQVDALGDTAGVLNELTLS
jgi:hypothetical protein